MNTTRYDFKSGAPILTDAGEVGSLKYIVVDSHAEVVTHLIVERGRLLRRDIVVPVGWVEHADCPDIRQLTSCSGDRPTAASRRPSYRSWNIPFGMASSNAPLSWSAAPRSAPETT